MENILNKMGLSRKDTIPVVHDKDFLYVYVKCDRCEEIIPVRISQKQEVQENYDKSKDKTYQYFVRKEVSGSGNNRCFARIGLYLEFDSQFRVIGTEIKGGSFVSKADYESSTNKNETK
ncbi:MAG: hypothetical protein PHD88_10620 [Firmicutes bacterium]|nr:hypothetical protein [Bacillota bacterium]